MSNHPSKFKDMKNLKSWAIALAAVITLHLYFNANKRYNINSSYNYSIDKMSGLTAREYDDILKAAKGIALKGVIYRNTRVDYFGSFPEEAIYIFYPLYFIVLSGVILSINKKK